MKKLWYVFLFLFLFFWFLTHSTYAAVVEIPCSSRSHFTSTCNQCFYQDVPIYLWWSIQNLSDTWIAGSAWELIYLDENPNSFNLRVFYTNGEIERWSGIFNWASTLFDGITSNGEIFRDADNALFARFLPWTRGRIIEAQSNFFIKFANLTQAIRNNGRNHPLWETQYTFNYYSIWSWTQKKHTECVLSYPARCWDRVIDRFAGETCDDGNNLDGDGCSATCRIEIWLWTTTSWAGDGFPPRNSTIWAGF